MNIQEPRKLDAFDGLRGIASFVVLIYHLRMTFYPKSFLDLTSHLQSFPYILKRPLVAIVSSISDGGFAVGLFWLLSAFVLSLRYFRYIKEDSSDRAHSYLEDALLRRYPRLLIPVISSVLFAYVLHAFGLMRNADLTATLGNAFQNEWIASAYSFPASFFHAMQSAVWQSFFGYRESETYNMVLWTMEKEFYGSVFLFAFLSLAGHRTSRFFLYPTISLICYFLNLNWLISFVVGIAMCDFYINTKQNYISNSVFCVVSRISQFWIVPVWLMTFVCIGLPNYLGVFNILVGSIVILITLTSNLSKKVLCSPIPAFLGKISFGMYLIHAPIICSFSSFVYLVIHQRVGHDYAALIAFISTCIVSVYLGYLLHKFVDLPSVNISRIVSSRLMKSKSVILQK